AVLAIALATTWLYCLMGSLANASWSGRRWPSSSAIQPLPPPAAHFVAEARDRHRVPGDPTVAVVAWKVREAQCVYVSVPARWVSPLGSSAWPERRSWRA